MVRERDRGWFTTAPFSEPEVFDFPELMRGKTCAGTRVTGTKDGAGVLGAEAPAPRPFLDLLVAYGSPWGLREQ
ncbi:hypothetical protein QF048_007262 [Streptomyces sp. W4I9-2]|nr:hypothetical protein [Streptomyces sp. W4I9-2]